MIRTFVRILLAAFLLLAVSVPAFADTYLDNTARTMQASGQHVWQDPAMHIITDAQVAELENKIVASGKPVYVAVVDQAKLSSTDSNTYPVMFHDAMKRDGAYVVVGLKAFRAAGFNTSQSVASSVPSLATAAFNAAKARGATQPDMQAIDQLVTGIVALDFTKSAVPPAQAPAAPNTPSKQSGDISWLWWLLIPVMVIVLLVIFFWKRSKRRKEEDEAAKATYTAYPHYEAPRDGSGRNVRSFVDARSAKPGTRYAVHNSYSDSHPHYWAGGMYGGRSYGPGYYSDPFWNYIMLDTILDHHDHSYGHGGYDGHDSMPSSMPSSHITPPSPSSTPSSGNYDSGYSGGGDFGSPRRSSDSGFSSSSSGGYDYGSSTSSFGGFDSGGFSSGSSGGGDF